MPQRKRFLSCLSFPLRFQEFRLTTLWDWLGTYLWWCKIKARAMPVSQRQYYIPHKTQIGIQKHLDRLLKYGIRWPCQSSWNTPLLPVQKPGTEDFRPVQDLHAVNSATVTLHPVVPNLYMLLGLIPAEAKFFTCLDLKDTFFCICLVPQSQPIFAFQWEFSSTGEKGQMAWT
jgi:hypothetical protein